MATTQAGQTDTKLTDASQIFMKRPEDKLTEIFVGTNIKSVDCVDAYLEIDSDFDRIIPHCDQCKILATRRNGFDVRSTFCVILPTISTEEPTSVDALSYF